MIDTLFELSALPNLHPALVHFPIALAAVAFLFDVVAFIGRRSAAVERSATALWVLAAVGAGATYLAGRSAADAAGALSAPAEAALAAHADAGLATVTALGLVALLRAWLAWRDAGSQRVRNAGFWGAVLMAGGMLQGLVAYTADLGGALVYRHGVAVSAQRAQTAAATSAGREIAAENGVAHLEDGSLLWTPIAGDEATFRRILEPVGDVAVRIAPAPAGADGLSLFASGRTLLRLPGAWEDVQLVLQLDASGFEGSVALGARIDAESGGGFVRFRSNGGAQLIARQEGSEHILDEAAAGLSANEGTIGLSAVGRHFKGFSGGRTVVHGHAPFPETGRVALLLDGSGPIRLISLRISPVNSGRNAETTHEERLHAY